MSADIIKTGNTYDHWTDKAVHDLEHRLREAIATAKRAEVPQGLIVAMLAGLTHLETASMVEGTA